MPTTGLRERKKQETRQRLRGAALQLVAERGMDRVTVDDIAAAADVSARTFFNYFSTKEEAVVGSEPEWMEHIAAVLAARPEGEAPLFALHAVLDEIAHLLAGAREVHAMRRKVVADNPDLLVQHVAGFAEFERVLVAALLERTDPGSAADTRIVVAAAVAVMRVCVDVWVDDPATDLPALLDSAINRLALGFGPTSARPVAPTRGSARKTTRKDLR
jgi:AcrR family transcriptional regulator